MIRFLFQLIIYFFFSLIVFPQTKEEMITVIGDSLFGRVINGESIREVKGNVILKQGNVVVTCNKAIQFIARNEAELIGNVIAKQDSLTLKTKSGFYYGDLKKTKSTSGVILDDTKVVLSADSGEYFFDESKAFFQSNVTLVDSTTSLTSDELTYFRELDKSISVGNVKVNDGSNTIAADTLIHFRKSKFSIADGNVSIRNYLDNITVYGSHLEDNGIKKFTIVDEQPLLVQIDTTVSAINDTLNDISIDTLFISSKIMEGYRDTTNLFKAIDSVRILRKNFASINDLTTYNRTDEKIITSKLNEEARRPILWYENSQLTGDSVAIYLLDGEIKNLEVNENAFMLSQNKIYKQRFDQTSSDSVKLKFSANRLRQADFEGKVQSIYFLFDDEKPNGAVKSSAHRTLILFEDNEVNEVRLFGSPTSEYYPEVKVEGLERTFTLPKFVLYENRPHKEDFKLNK
jgi:lipopolysaccharide export system protein LptA